MAEPQEGMRIVYGAGCVWWDTINKAGRLMGPHPLPCCPHCHGVLFEICESTWDRGAKEHNKSNPGYYEFITWLRGKCYKTLTLARAAYDKEEKDGKNRL